MSTASILTDTFPRLLHFARDDASYVRQLLLTNKEDGPIAKCTGWMSDKVNIVFNVWERLSPNYVSFVNRFYWPLL